MLSRIYYYIVLIVALCCLASCGTQRVVESNNTVTHDTLFQKMIQRDSVYFRDSVFTFVKGDTFVTKEYHVKYIDRLRVDTLRSVKTDTVVVRDVEYVEVKSKIGWKDKICMVFGLLCVGIFVFLFKNKNSC